MSPRSAQDQWVAQELAKALNRVQDPSQLGSTDEVSIHKKLRSFIFLWSCINCETIQVKWSGCVHCKDQHKFWPWPCRIVLDLREETHQSQREIAEGTSEIWAKCCHEFSGKATIVFCFCFQSRKFFRGFVSVSRRSDLKLCAANVPSNAQRLRGSMASQHVKSRKMLKA